MSTTPSPPVEYNQGTESVLSVSDLAPVSPQRPRRGRPRKVGREGESGIRPQATRRLGRDSQLHPQLPPPSTQPAASSSNQDPITRSMYAEEERPNETQPFPGHRFEPELHHDLFPLANPFRQSQTNIFPIFDNRYFSSPAGFDEMLQNNMGPVHDGRGGWPGGSMHPVRLDGFELGSQYSPASIDQRSISPSSQWSSDALSRVASIAPEERHFTPTPYFFDTMPLADPHWPSLSSNSQATFIPGVDMDEPGMVTHPELVMAQFSSPQSFSGVDLNSTMGPLHSGSSLQPSQNQNNQHEMQRHIHYADCHCPACQHFHNSSWESR